MAVVDAEAEMGLCWPGLEEGFRAGVDGEDVGLGGL